MHLAALALVANHLVFGVVKLVAYGESAALTFMAIDLVIVALLSRRPTAAARLRG